MSAAVETGQSTTSGYDMGMHVSAILDAHGSFATAEPTSYDVVERSDGLFLYGQQFDTLTIIAGSLRFQYALRRESSLQTAAFHIYENGAGDEASKLPISSRSSFYPHQDQMRSVYTTKFRSPDRNHPQRYILDESATQSVRRVMDNPLLLRHPLTPFNRVFAPLFLK